MNVDLKRLAGNNHAKITIDIDGLGRTIVFKSGGVTESPVAFSATAGGGTTVDGLYEHWLVEGEVTVSKDLARFLLDAYKKGGRISSAIYEIYSNTDHVIIKHQFDNVCVVKLPSINVDSLGGEVSMPVAFSLNDYVSTEVIDA